MLTNVTIGWSEKVNDEKGGRGGGWGENRCFALFG